MLKKKILEIYNNYKNDLIKRLKVIKHKLRKFIKKFKKYFGIFKKNLLSHENRKKYLALMGILIIVNLLILINFYTSSAYYYVENSFSLIRASVGNVYLRDYDYTLLVYLEESDDKGNGKGKYYLTDDIPSVGYSYSGYSCVNNSILIYDANTKTTSVTTDQKDVCSIYFNII